jgi:hypothetical protein
MRRNWFTLFVLFVLIIGVSGCFGNRRSARRGGGQGRSGKPGAVGKTVNVVPSNRYTVTSPDGVEASIPMVASRVERGSPNIERAILLIPAVGRQIQGFHSKIQRLSREEGMDDKTLVIGLQFLYPGDLEEHEITDNVLYWDEYAWSMGDVADEVDGMPRPFRISSFSMVDSLVEEMIEEFPNLNTILVTGNSAGSKFTQRYAIGTRMPEAHPDVHFGFISSNGGTFMYMTPERPQTGKLDEWFTPNADECERYNEYPLGLENLNEYQAVKGVENIREVYANRNYVYLIGSLDTRPDYSFCAYTVQGQHRLDRNKAYWNYLQYYYGESITEHQHFHIIEGATHIGPTYETAIGRHYLFEWVPGDASTYDL